MFKYYRSEVSRIYNPNEFAIPDTLKFFPIYLSTALHQPCFNYKKKINEDYKFYTFINLKNLTLNNIFFFLYP